MAQDFSGTGVGLDDFVPDRPYPPAAAKSGTDEAAALDLIDGVTAIALVGNADARGSLFELLTTRDGPIEPIVHVYQVSAAPGSIRAWVFHRHQYDRLAFIMGRFEIALFDMRPDSPTVNRLNVFALGAEQPCLLGIPPYVMHGVRNAGTEWAFFTNMPTKVFDRNDPDKARLEYGDPRIPFTFDAR